MEQQPEETWEQQPEVQVQEEPQEEEQVKHLQKHFPEFCRSFVSGKDLEKGEW